MNKEIWKNVPDYEQYQVSNHGRVRRWQRKNKKWYYLKLSLPKSGNPQYYMVSLCTNNKHKKFLVHRLVAVLFLPNPNSLPQVNHKDFCKTNNFVWVNDDGSADTEKSNLEWCDNSYNVSYGTPNAAKQILQIDAKTGVVVKKWDTCEAAAAAIKKSQTGISNVIAGRAKTCGGYKWAIKNED